MKRNTRPSSSKRLCSWVGLDWVGLGQVGSRLFSFGGELVGSTIAKELNISSKSLFLSDIMTLFSYVIIFTYSVRKTNKFMLG